MESIPSSPSGLFNMSHYVHISSNVSMILGRLIRIVTI